MLSSPNQDKPLTIVNFGSHIEGLDRVKGGLFFQAATRLTSVVSIGDYLQSKLDAKDQFEKKFALSLKRNSGTIFFSLDWSKGEDRSNFRAEFDEASGYCKSSINTVTSGSQPPYEWAVEKQYDNGIVVPLLHTEKRSQPGTVAVHHIVKRDFFEAGPSPLGLFSLDAQGVSQGNVWLRRMIMLTVGMVALGGFFCIASCVSITSRADSRVLATTTCPAYDRCPTIVDSLFRWLTRGELTTAVTPVPFPVQ